MSAYTRVRVRPRPAHSPRTPTARDYEESLGPPQPTVPMTPPHAPTPTPTPTTKATDQPSERGGSAGPTRSCGSCRSGPGRSSLTRAWSPGSQGVGEQPSTAAGGGMDATGCMGSHAGGCAPSLGSPSRELLPPQDHLYVLRRLRQTIPETRREGKRLWDITPSQVPPTDTPLPPRKGRRTDAGSANTTLTRSTPGTPRASQHDSPDPPGGRGALTPPQGRVTSLAMPGPHADDAPCHHRPPLPAALTPGREPIHRTCRRAS